MNVSLTVEQLHAVRDGATVRVPVPELAMECVIVRADLYARVRSVVDETVTEHEVASLIDSSMREYDADDPSLESYQQYRRG
ncbi:MAG TPA: hypothetical protein VFI31_26925 [Pirellulales bacterium]|nr:hypothetical protein [Pirellulales bacterium]